MDLYQQYIEFGPKPQPAPPPRQKRRSGYSEDLVERLVVAKGRRKNGARVVMADMNATASIDPAQELLAYKLARIRMARHTRVLVRASLAKEIQGGRLLRESIAWARKDQVLKACGF